uniref:Uncharacterized protein n=1 Tax=Arundo donax TaxID=35708 RepID=A0A0A9FTG0_ARUDO
MESVAVRILLQYYKNKTEGIGIRLFRTDLLLFANMEKTADLQRVNHRD